MDPLLIYGLVRVVLWGVLLVVGIRHKRALISLCGGIGMFQSAVFAPKLYLVPGLLPTIATFLATPFVALLVSAAIIGASRVGDTGKWRL